LSILKDGAAAGITPEGSGAAGFTFTVAEGGQYTARFTMTPAVGAAVTKSYDFGVIEAGAVLPDVTFEEIANESKTGLGLILQYSVSDEEEGDKTSEASVRVWSGTDKAGTEVTDDVVYKVSNKTGNNATVNTEHYPDELEYFTAAGEMNYTVFRPVSAGDYYVEVGYINGKGAYGSASRTVSVSDGVNAVYGYTVEGTKNLDKMAVGKDGTVIFGEGIDGTGNASLSRSDLGNATFEGSWEMSYYLTDLKYNDQGKFFTTLHLENTDDPDVDIIWDDVTVGGKANNDLWGYEANIYGTGWRTYEWRGVWQDPTTNEFKHPDVPASDRFGTNYNGNGFREAPGYRQYGFGKHKYTVKYLVNAETGAVTIDYYIDDIPECRHVTAAAHNKYTKLQYVKIFSEKQMSGIMTGLTFKDLN
jgi:hypothetical protein